MKLGHLILGTGAAAVIALAPATASAQFDANAGTALMAVLLAKEMGVDTHVVLDLSTTNGWDSSGYYAGAPTNCVYDIAPVFVIWQNIPRRPRPIEILQYRRRGWGWDRIWTYYRLPMARYRVLLGDGRFDPNYWGRVVTVHRFNVPRDTVVQLRSGGMGWRDVTYATITAREARQPVLTVAANWRTSRNWNSVVTHFRVNPANIRAGFSEVRRARALPTRWRVNAPPFAPGHGTPPRPGHGVVHPRPGHPHPPIRPGHPIRPGQPIRPRPPVHAKPRTTHQTVVRHNPHSNTVIHRTTTHKAGGKTVTHSKKTTTQKKKHGPTRGPG